MEGHRVRRQRSSTTKTKQPEPLERIQPNAAGIDCGSRHHHVAVPVDRDPEPVHRFKTFTPDLYRMVDWREACRIDTVAMEATGVYWIPIYDILEQRGFKVVLVNARHVKNVPGRKTDVVDCQVLPSSSVGEESLSPNHPDTSRYFQPILTLAPLWH